MNLLLVPFFALFFLLGDNSPETPHFQDIKNKINFFQSQEKILKVSFPFTPETYQDELPLKEYSIKVTFHVAKNETEMYTLFEFELGEFANEINNNPYEFINGFLTYIVLDLGAHLESMSEFQFNDFVGYAYVITHPNEDNNPMGKGRSLITDNHAYIWMGFSNSNEFPEEIEDFINSYRL